jgi:hypothetical protein
MTSSAAAVPAVAADASATWLQDELGALVGGLDLNPRQKVFWRGRWLDQVVWLDGKAKQAQKRHYVLRLIAIVGGLTVPALVSLDVHRGRIGSALSWVTFAVSLLVAIAVAVEGFFRYGERWRHYRRTCEQLKGHGWQFYELAGAYAGFASHRAAFRTFATTVEALIAEDVDVYIKHTTREDHRQPQDPAGDGGATAEARPEG